MRIGIAADHGGYALKARIIRELTESGHEVSDLGTNSTDPVDYPDYAKAVAEAILQGRAERAILLCGSGQGICIAANRFKGIRAAVCDTPEEARVGRNDDDTNVLCLPAKALSEGRAEDIVKAWLDTAFAGAARYKRRIVELDQLG